VDAPWDVIVVGGGPAGALAAHELARTGASTLLVERARMPRAKVCGGCLDAEALSALAACGLGGLPARLGAVPLHTAEIRAGGRPPGKPLRVPLHGAGLQRATLDAALLEAAQAAGARVLTGVEARLDPADAADDARRVLLGADGAQRVERARLVLAADGLAGRLLDGRPAPSARRALLGAGVVLPDAGAEFPAGVVSMACGPGGYAGATRVDGGRLCVAAALDARAVRAAGGLGAAVHTIFSAAGHAPPPGLAQAAFRATPALTRRARRLGARRVLALGDAAGFVEPFTGQGMAWAFLAARTVVPTAHAAVQDWHDGLVGTWDLGWRTTVARRQRACRAAAFGLRHPRLMRLAVGALAPRPELLRPLLARLLPGTA
jgi:flavin-dependent dehydrogenase